MYPRDKELMKSIIEWDVANWNRAIDFWKVVPTASRKRVLDLGGRNGGLSLFWALKGYDVICSDLDDSAFDKARELHRRYHVEDKVYYQVINALDIPFEEFFDVITFKSVLGGVGRDDCRENQFRMIDQIYKALKPGGSLYFAENLTGSKIHMMLRRRFRRWGNSWRYISVDEVKTMTAGFENMKYDTYGILGLFGRSGPAERIFSDMDNKFDHFVPENYRYIISVVCQKPNLNME